MNELMNIRTFEEFEAAFDHEVRNQAESFIRMGYLLRIAQDTDILYESKYSTIAEFAKAKYNLSADYVSRMIDVNKRYSEGGYSPYLQGKYQGYGYTLLSEMLTLSDQVVDALPDNVTREDIRDIKREIKEEQKITDIEVLLEEKEETQENQENNLAKALHQYWREHIREYPAMFKAITSGDDLKETTIRFLAPSGLGVLMVRVKGIGKLMLSIKGEDKDLELLNVRTNKSETDTWNDCIKAMLQFCKGRNYKESFEKVYGEPYPEEKKDESKPQIPAKVPDKAHGTAEKAAGKEPEKEPVKEDAKPGVENPESPVNTGAPAVFAPAQTEEEHHSGDINKMVPTEEIAAEPEEMPEQIGGEPMEPVQQSIEQYAEVLPESYMPQPEVVTRKEVELWKDAAQSAVRLFNTLEGNDWNPDCIKLVREMCVETANLKVILESLRELMEIPE